MPHSIRIDRDLEMKTRDGVILRADVVRPDIRSKVPAIVMRTPYDKTIRALWRFLPATVAAAAGFAVVIQDIRGRFASEGEWDFLGMRETEGRDGYDCIEWVATEPWCDGNIGMTGGSYVAETQFAAATANPPSLKAIAPALMGIGGNRVRSQRLHLESILVGYMAMMAMDVLQRKLPTGQADPDDLARVMEVMRDPRAAASVLPLRDLMSLNTPGIPTYAEVFEVIRNLTPGESRGEEAFHVPALWTSGWYDITGGGESFRAMRDRAATRAAREGSRLILGPWTHNYAETFVGAIGFGQFSSAEGAGIPQAHLTFFSRHLRGEDVDIPVVRYFVMGINQWKEAQDWPIPGTEARLFYLRSSGHANSADGDGVLAPEVPSAGEPPDRYRYDPAQPVPSWGFRVMYTGGSTVAGPVDQNRVECRSDVLCYTSDPMTKPLEIVGDVDLILWISSSARDTDFVAKLCDVDPAGNSINLADGFIRCRYRESWDDPKFLEPGEVIAVSIQLGPTGHVFLPGHRVRVQIASSAFPHYDRNMNTGNAPGEDVEGVVAEQSVFHTKEWPSHVALPVVVAAKR